MLRVLLVNASNIPRAPLNKSPRVWIKETIGEHVLRTDTPSLKEGPSRVIRHQSTLTERGFDHKNTVVDVSRSQIGQSNTSRTVGQCESAIVNLVEINGWWIHLCRGRKNFFFV